MYIKVNNGVPENYTIGQLRKDNPNVSFPRSVPDDILASYDVYEATILDEPVVNHNNQKATLNSVAEQVDGAWVYGWSVQEKTADEIQQQNDAKSKSVRDLRDSALKNSDWVVLKAIDKNAQDGLGVQIPQVWLDYRQALRDITDHANFPYLTDEDWPVAP